MCVLYVSSRMSALCPNPNPPPPCTVHRYMLAFGDLAWVPFIYSLQARCVSHKCIPQVSHWPTIPRVVLHVTCLMYPHQHCCAHAHTHTPLTLLHPLIPLPAATWLTTTRICPPSPSPVSRCCSWLDTTSSVAPIARRTRSDGTPPRQRYVTFPRCTLLVFSFSCTQAHAQAQAHAHTAHFALPTSIPPLPCPAPAGGPPVLPADQARHPLDHQRLVGRCQENQLHWRLAHHSQLVSAVRNTQSSTLLPSAVFPGSVGMYMFV